MKTYISPKARKGLKSNIHGRGIFAKEPIKAGEIVAIKKGRILTYEQFEKAGLKGHPELQIDDNLYITPTAKEEFEDSMIFINHSCEPNVGMKDAITFIAMRDIKSGEELTIDYAMIDDNNNHIMNCTCSSKDCRKKITGKDWINPKLQKKYKGFFSPFIQKKIIK